MPFHQLKALDYLKQNQLKLHYSMTQYQMVSIQFYVINILYIF